MIPIQSRSMSDPLLSDIDWKIQKRNWVKLKNHNFIKKKQWKNTPCTSLNNIAYILWEKAHSLIRF